MPPPQENWGPLFEQAVDEAHNIFRKLLKDENAHGREAKLSKEEFAHALRFMQADGVAHNGGSKVAYDRLIDFMFNAIDLGQEGLISFYEFVEWILMMNEGGHEDKLRCSD